MAKQKVKLPKDLPEHHAKQFQDVIFVTAEVEGEDSYRNTYDIAADAVDCGDHDGTYVATYKLVKVEKLALKRSTKLVKV